MSKSTAKKQDEKEILRGTPSVFPVGFRFGNMNGEICFVDFVDSGNGDKDYYIFQSIALSKSTAKQLSDGLLKFLKDDEQ